MKIDKNQILERLKLVKDPISGSDIVSTNRVGPIEIKEGNIYFSLLYPQNLDATQKSQLNFACISTLQKSYPDIGVHVHFETQIRENIKNTSVLPQVKNIIAVASGKGGVGKSTVSSNLALGLQRSGARVGLLDADLYGPSIPTMLGLEGQRPRLQELYGKPKIIPLEAYGIKVMSIGFVVEPEQAVVLRGPRLAGIVKQFIEECLWPELDYLVIDLPPGTGDIQLTLVQTVPLTGAIIVTTPQKVSVADAIKAMNMFSMSAIKVPIIGIIENMSWFSPAELPNHKYYLFGKGGGKTLVEKSQAPLLGQIPIMQSIMAGGESGKPAILNTENAALQDIWIGVTQETINSINRRNESIEPTEIVRIKS